MCNFQRGPLVALTLSLFLVACAEGKTDDGSCTADADCAHLTDACSVGVCDLQQDACYAQPHVDAVCDDDDPCTTDDVCDSDGACAGSPYECTPSAPCMSTECDGEGACTEAVQSGFCAIETTAIECYADELDHPDDPCRWCDADADPAGWTVKPSGSVCGSSADPCGRQSTCNDTGVCVDQGYPPAGTACGGTPAGCEGQDSCDGAGHCINSGLAPAGTVCRPSIGDCDPAEVCSGATADCPADQITPEGGDCGTCRTCDDAGQCVVNSTDHADCGDCHECATGVCVVQPSGQDRKDLCPDLVCTGYLWGASGADCHAYATSTVLNGFCGGSGTCASAADSCENQGAVVQTCADVACVRCPAGGSSAQACYNDLLQHGCASGYVCSAGDCIVDPGSCPFLYTWDGSDFAFETDIYGSGKLGVRLASGYWQPTPDDYYLLQNEPVQTGGSLELRLVEERSEVNYFDFASLVVADVPQGVDVYSELHGLGTPYVPLEDSLHTVSQVLQPPVAATRLNVGGSVLAPLSQADGVYAVLGNDRNLDFDYETVELDLGDLAGAPQIKLVIDGTTVFPNSPAGIARKTMFGAPTRVEVLDDNLQWVEVPKSVFYMPPPKEARRPFVMDITGIFVTDVYRIRLTWLFKTYLDFIGLDTTLDLQPTLQTLPLETADLRYYGHSQRIGAEVFQFVYGSVSQELWPPFPGNYTRFGDVTPLLDSVDDKFVIFWAGDEVALRFTPPAPPPANTHRRYILHSHGYYKDLTFGGSHQVELLPFGAMSNYPYDPAVEHYPDDADHVSYQTTYNTRSLP